MDEYKRKRRLSRAVMSMFLDSIGGSIDNVDVATFDSDGSDLKALIVGIDPNQDLHGYEYPWPGGGRGNFLDPSKRTSYGGGYGQRWYATEGYTLLANQAYTFSVTYANPIALYIRDKATDDVLVNGNSAISYTPTSDTIVYFQAFRGEDISSVDTFQLEFGSTATPFVPYSNICPITGHSSVNVIVSPTLNPLDGTITNIPLGGTYYDGQLDVLTGVLTDTAVNIASYNGETINEPWISSMDAYSPGATPTIGAQVVYPLATPQTAQLTGQQIATFVGTNNVWCSSGQIIHLEY